jgi:VanZ family protein
MSWLYVAIWSLVIFATIPVARVLQKFVSQRWGRETFTYVVLVGILIAFGSSLFYLRRLRAASLSSYFWLLATAAVFVGYTIHLRNAPEEAVHFLQYGLLGILTYRALAYRFHDVSIYFVAAIICGIIGMLDEIIQWLTPARYWGLHDVWLNFVAGSLVQIGIAKGLTPSIIRGMPSRRNLQVLCRFGMAAVVLMGFSLLNTPELIGWYADRIPCLGFLKQNESVMAEYGYLYIDPDIGSFRSRFSPSELRQSDRERAKEAAEILDRYQIRDKYKYKEFLKIYTPVSDPFVHEAGVHLFRRDYFFRVSKSWIKNQEVYSTYHLTIAFRENQIMETYFRNTLHHSAYVWSAEKFALAKKHLMHDKEYDSRVSKNLITRISMGQLGSFFVLLIIGLALLHFYSGRSKSNCSSS